MRPALIILMRSALREASNVHAPALTMLIGAIIVSCFVASSGCQSGASSVETNSSNSGVIIVNAPAAGEVRRVLVREGMEVDANAPIVEIAVRNEAAGAPQARNEDPVARAGQNIQASEAEIKAARDEVVRTDVEVQRLTALVSSGAASQGELDGARALYERAQQRLQQAQAGAQNAQAGLVAARQPSRNQTSAAPPAASEQLVYARATSAGTVRVLSARVGDHVAAGQPLATLRAE